MDYKRRVKKIEEKIGTNKNRKLFLYIGPDENREAKLKEFKQLYGEDCDPIIVHIACLNPAEIDEIKQNRGGKDGKIQNIA